MKYSIAEQFAAWVSRQAPAMLCDWRLAELLDLTSCVCGGGLLSSIIAFLFIKDALFMSNE